MPGNKVQIILEAVDKTKDAFQGLGNSFKSLGDKFLNIQNLFRTAIYSAPMLPETNEELKKLAEQWEKIKDALELKVAEMGLSEYNAKLVEIEATYKKIEEIAIKAGVKDRTLIEKAKWVDIMKAYQEKLLEEEDMTIESAKKKEEAQKWLTDRINELTLSEFDYKRMKLLEEYQLQANIIGWTEELYKTFTGNLKKIDDEELKNKQDKLNAIREAELKHNLAMIDLAEQEFRISKPEAIQQRIDANQELLRIQEEHLSLLDKIKDASAWYAQQDAIDRTRQSLLELNLALKEQAGTFKEGLIEGLNRYQRDAQTAFQGGLQVVQDVTSGMTSAFESFFDYTSEKFMDFGKLATDILNDIYKAVMQALVIEPLVQGFMGLFSSAPSNLFTGTPETALIGMGMHTGGKIEYIPRFDFGGESRLVMAKVGERFITKEQNEWLTSQAKTNKKENNQAQIVNININAVDARSFSDLINRNPGAIVSPVMNALKKNSALRYEIMEGM